MAGWILSEDTERVVIATFTSKKAARYHNAKTGQMIQVWIMAKNESPMSAIKHGNDSKVCGNCRHRGVIDRILEASTGIQRWIKRTCYVRMDTAPSGIWKAYQRGSYKFLPRSRYADVFYNRMIRWGAYGDPFFIPREVIVWASFYASGWTGYTHQWQEPSAQWLREYLMASVDSWTEYEHAKLTGWRTFRVTNEPIKRGSQHEIMCPASKEAGHLTQCNRCGLCNGVRYRTDPRADIVIPVHGRNKRNFQQVLALIQITAI